MKWSISKILAHLLFLSVVLYFSFRMNFRLRVELGVFLALGCVMNVNAWQYPEWWYQRTINNPFRFNFSAPPTVEEYKRNSGWQAVFMAIASVTVLAIAFLEVPRI
jgi:hypothetical protein